MTYTNMDDLNRDVARNSTVEGTGMEVENVFACPFCATPEAMRMLVLDTSGYPRVIPGACTSCDRKFECRITKDDQGTIEGRFFQTAGDDMPEWFQPPMPRSEPTV